MENFFSRYRNASVLVLVLFAQVLGLAVQVKRPSEAGGTRLLRVWVVSTVTPLERALVDSGQAVRNIWKNYVYLRGVRHENRELKDQLERLRIEQVRLSEDAAQARRLQSLLGFKEQFISRTLAAQVIGSSGSDLSRVIYIDKGSNDGVRVDMAVITPDGIVGKVLRVFPLSSQVLVINDGSSGVGAILEKSRLQGILQGTASGETMLRYVMSDEKVEPGERIVTSGGDRIFPKGLPVGTVIQSSPGSDLFLNIRVKPTADLGRLEEVLVVTKIADTTPATEEASGRIRAADILAQRLPSVPQKPATGADAAAGGAAKPATGSAQAPSVAKPATTAAASSVAGGAKPVASTAATAGATKPITTATTSPADKPTATAPVAKPNTAVTAPAAKPTTATATPAGSGAASGVQSAAKPAAASPQAASVATTPKAGANPKKPSAGPAARVISDDSVTNSPSAKPAGSATRAPASATVTGDAPTKPAVVKPAATTKPAGGTDPQKPKQSNSTGQSAKPATPPAQTPPSEEPSR